MIVMFQKAKKKPIIISTTRFTEKTFNENIQWKKSKNWSGCSYGITKELCSSLPPINNFYATGITSYDGKQCIESNPDGTYNIDPYPGNNIFGCALDNITNEYALYFNFWHICLNLFDVI